MTPLVKSCVAAYLINSGSAPPPLYKTLAIPAFMLRRNFTTMEITISRSKMPFNVDVNSEAVTMPYLKKQSKTTFEDLCGLEELKSELRALITSPVLEPHLYANIGKCGINKNFLFFGPPGTGKSYIAEAIAGEMAKHTKFFSTVADLLYPEAENIRKLFTLARMEKSSIIFIDDLDYLAPSDSELLRQMNDYKNDNDGLIIMTATNMPQNINPKILRQFELIYVPLPNKLDRYTMLKQRLTDAEHCDYISDEQFNELAIKTSGFSASDIDKLCEISEMLSLNTLIHSKYFRMTHKDNSTEPFYTPCEPIENGAIQMSFRDVPKGRLSFIRKKTTIEDVFKSLSDVKLVDKSVIREIEKFAGNVTHWGGSIDHEPTELRESSCVHTFLDFFISLNCC